MTATEADFWHDARPLAEIHEEVAFAVQEFEDEVPKVLGGATVFDYRPSDAWQLIDYKSDPDGELKDLAARHIEQSEA